MPSAQTRRTRKGRTLGSSALKSNSMARTDNLGKAKGFAEYARQNPGVGRLQLIRLLNGRIKRLDMSLSAVRDRVSHAMSNDELDHIFDEDGFFG